MLASLMPRRAPSVSSSPASDKRAPAVKPKRLQQTSIGERVHIGPAWRDLFIGVRPVYVVDHDPAPLRKLIAVTVDVSAFGSIGIEDYQTHLIRAECLTYSGYRLRLKRLSLDQCHHIRNTLPDEIAFQVTENVASTEPFMFHATASFDRDQFL